jgi:hypothetical protein
VPIQPLATATANGTSSASLVTIVKSGTTIVAAATSGASALSSSGASASSSSGPELSTGAASSICVAGGVVGSALIAMLMTIFA